MEAPGAAGPDPLDSKHLGGQPSLRERVTNGAKSDILNFPIFHFKAEPAKPVKVKPKRTKKVNAEKGKKGTDDITKYFVKSADTTKPRPTEHQADLLNPSQSKLMKE